MIILIQIFSDSVYCDKEKCSFSEKQLFSLSVYKLFKKIIYMLQQTSPRNLRINEEELEILKIPRRHRVIGVQFQ